MSIFDEILVSVVIPSYNHGLYLERSILSVLNQTHPSVELVVIDDGSTDDSIEILKKLKARFGFTLVCQENRGVCKTLNRGIREYANGKYIALLASDDFWHPDKIKLQLEQLQLFPNYEFCFSQAVKFFDENKLQQGKVFPKRCLSGQIINQVFLRQHVPAGTMLFSRDLYNRLGGFDENLKEEDWDFVIRCASVTSFASVNKPLLYYRSHEENIMKMRSRILIFHEKAKILSKNFNLVSPWRWLLAINFHFAHDILLSLIRRLLSLGVKK